MAGVKSMVGGVVVALGIVAAGAVTVQATTIRDEAGVEQALSPVVIPQPTGTPATPSGESLRTGSGHPT